MQTNLRILYLEDEPNDAELVREILTAADFECEILRVETRADFTDALKESHLDLILSDKSLPAFDGLSALAIVREQRPEVPFIFVSGTLGEEVAIESLKNGATDYVLKQRLERLVPVIWRALHEVDERQERQKAVESLRESERHYRQLIETAQEGVWVIDVNNHTTFVNKRLADMLGYPMEDMIGKSIYDFEDEEGKAISSKNIERRRQGVKEQVESKFIRKDGTVLWALMETSALRDSDQKYTGALAMLTDITERKRAEQQVRQRAEEFAALYETATDLMTQTDLTSVLQTVVQRAMTLLGAPGGALLLYDAARHDLEIVVSQGAALEPGTRIKMGEGIAGRVAATRQPMIVNDYSNWAERPSELPDFGLRASIQVPMVYQGELIGVLALGEINAEHVFSESDLNLLSLFASQAAGAVHSARLLEQTQQRANLLASVYDAGLALNSVLEPRAQLEFLFKIAIRALHAERAEFFHYEPASNELRFELGIGHPPETLARLTGLVLQGEDEDDIAGWVSKYRVPLSVPDVSIDSRWHGHSDAGIHAGIWVAVEHEDKLLGVLGVLSERLHAFTPMDERMLVLFANQAAVAMENARLFEETTRRAAQLSTLNGIGRAISTLQNIDAVLEVIYQQVQHSLLLDTFYVSLYDSETNQLSYPLLYDSGERFQESPTPMHEGTNLSRVIQTSTPLLLNRTTEELTADPQPLYALGEETKKSASLLYAPLQVGTRVIGVMSAQSYILNAYNDEHLALLSGIANQAAIAIENARLFDQTRRQVERLGALRAIDMAISGSVDLRVTLNIFLEQVVKQLEVDAASVLLFNPYLNTLEYAAGRGFRTRAIERLTLRLGQGFAGEAALHQKLVFFPNLSARENESPRLSQLKAEAFEAYVIVPLITKGNVTGILEIFHRAPLNLAPEWLDFLEALGGQAAIAIDNALLFKNLQRSNADLSLAYDATIEGWSKALDLRDKETEGHTQRVTEMTLRLARSMQVREEELVHIRRGALLHDIGKMGVPDHILLKPGPLTEEEWVIMRQHPTLAFEMLSFITYLQPALSIPYCHHEKWDGTGYPRGLIGEQIPQAARIFAVADVWDALRSDRPYRKGWTEEKVRHHIQEQSGKHFDPQIVDVFLALDSVT